MSSAEVIQLDNHRPRRVPVIVAQTPTQSDEQTDAQIVGLSQIGLAYALAFIGVGVACTILVQEFFKVR